MSCERSRRRLCAALFAALAVAAPAPATAEGPGEPGRLTARLAWHRDDDARDCIAAHALEVAIESRWGRDVFGKEANTDVLVDGRVGRTAGGAWSARIELSARDGTPLGSRELVTKARHCSALDDSLALAIGLMLDVSKARVEELERQKAVAEAKPPAPPPRETPIRVPAQTVAPRQPFLYEPALSAVASLGTLPDPAFGGELSLLVVPPQFWSFEISTAWLLPQEHTDRGSGAEIHATTFALAVCPFDLEGVIEVRFCAVQRAAIVTSRGFGFDRNARQTDLGFGLGVLARASLRVAGPIRLKGLAGVEAPLSRFDFVYEDDSGTRRSLGATSPITASIAVGVGVRF